MNIAANIEAVCKNIPPHVTLICVSKFQPIEAIQEAYQASQRCFGENKPQEMMAKAAQLPADIQWHFIGNLQTNKVKYVVPIATLIHSVSNTRLIQEINKVAAKNSIISKILLEIHVANEETKQGFTPEELTDLITPQFIESYPNIQFCGVMGMASYTENQEQIRKEFTTIAQTFNTLKQNTFKDKPYFKEISMGMSGDYTIAIQQGATMVRIGSTIFGQRDY